MGKKQKRSVSMEWEPILEVGNLQLSLYSDGTVEIRDGIGIQGGEPHAQESSSKTSPEKPAILKNMKATCSKNPKHKEFVTTAHVMQDWKVDEEGNFLECMTECVQTDNGPDPDNIWTCAVCGSKAEVSR